MSSTAPVCYIRSLRQLLQLHGVDDASFLDRLGVTPELLADVDARIARDTVTRAWDLAARLTGSESVGLLASVHLGAGQLPVLDHLAANRPTVGDALRAMARYGRLCDAEVAMSCETVPEGIVVTVAPAADPRRESRHWSEWFLGLLLSRARSLGRLPELRPLRVGLEHRPPHDARALDAVLGVTPAFSAAATTIAFAHEVSRTPIRGASPFLDRVLTAQAERDLGSACPASTLGSWIRRILLETMERETPRLQAVARQARCSPRTLQARLRKEGTSFERLLDDTRRQRALQYAEDPSVRLIEIPLLLRFAEPSPYHRAFKRWTGQTPLAYRRARLGGADRPR